MEFEKAITIGNRMCKQVGNCNNCPVSSMIRENCCFSYSEPPFLNDDYSYLHLYTALKTWDQAHPPREEITWKHIMKKYFAEPESNAFMLEQPVPDEVYNALVEKGILK